jgi:predicted aldo/keto reductase-like oxidoreductase
MWGEDAMQKRKLGRTGLETSLMGFGGFHLLEASQSDAEKLLNGYLDRGGNYIETAREYGNGLSERKIQRAVSHRRSEFILATKSPARTREGLLESLEQSLKDLQTDHVELFFMHHVQTIQEADQILGPGGAMEGAVEAQKAGKLRFIGLTGHGQPDSLIYSVEQYPYDVLMCVLNYYDRFNFPKTEGVLLPDCEKRGVGVMAMKSLADGYLFRSPENALRYSLSLPVACVVAGINREEYLRKDLEAAERFQPMSDDEREELFRTAPELGNYVCRLCKKCKDADGFEPYLIFLLEGLFDRQMDDGRVPAADQYALRERLRFWFGQSGRARDIYQSLTARVDPGKDYSHLNPLCPYGIDIDRKLKVCHAKLSGEAAFF